MCYIAELNVKRFIRESYEILLAVKFRKRFVLICGYHEGTTSATLVDAARRHESFSTSAKISYSTQPRDQVTVAHNHQKFSDQRQIRNAKFLSIPPPTPTTNPPKCLAKSPTSRTYVALIRRGGSCGAVATNGRLILRCEIVHRDCQTQGCFVYVDICHRRKCWSLGDQRRGRDRAQGLGEAMGFC